MLPHAHLFDEAKSGRAELGQFRQGHHGGAKTLSFDEGWVSLDLWVKRVFLVKIGEDLLTCLCNKEFDEQFRLLHTRGMFQHTDTGHVHNGPHPAFLLIRHQHCNGRGRLCGEVTIHIVVIDDSERDLPFGDGPRICIGMAFAMIEAKAVLADLASRIHNDLAATMHFARVWGRSVFDGQTVQREHVLEEGDVVEIH